MRRSLICIVLAGSATVHADDLAEARRLQATLEYDKALAIVDAAIARGGAEPAQLAELHMLAGELTAGLDRQAEAEDHFVRAMAVRPDVALPAGTSPKLTTPFEAARARDARLALHTTFQRGQITIVADADPLGMVAGVAVRIVDAQGRHGELVSRTATNIAVAPGTTAIEVAALDARGNRVWLGTVPASSVDLPPRVLAREAPSPVARSAPWAIATVALAAAGGAFAWKTSSLQSQWNAANDGLHDYSQLAALESRGKDYAIAADIAFGLTAVAAVATAIVYLRTPSYATLAVSPSGLAIAGRF